MSVFKFCIFKTLSSLRHKNQVCTIKLANSEHLQKPCQQRYFVFLEAPSYLLAVHRFRKCILCLKMTLSLLFPLSMLFFSERKWLFSSSEWGYFSVNFVKTCCELFFMCAHWSMKITHSFPLFVCNRLVKF